MHQTTQHPVHHRILSALAAAAQVKEEGNPNDLLQRVAADESFGLSLERMPSVPIEPTRMRRLFSSSNAP